MWTSGGGGSLNEYDEVKDDRKGRGLETHKVGIIGIIFIL